MIAYISFNSFIVAKNNIIQFRASSNNFFFRLLSSVFRLSFFQDGTVSFPRMQSDDAGVQEQVLVFEGHQGRPSAWCNRLQGGDCTLRARPGMPD